MAPLRLPPRHVLPTPLAELSGLLQRQPRTRIVERDEAYLRAEFRTRLLRFTDDLEVLVDEAAGVAHVRSASRIGHSDLGTNRRRVEALRRQWEQRLAELGRQSGATP